MTERLYLTGFMTCGKSTIGPILANTLGWNFYDLDDVIEELEGMTVVEIFKAKGEKYFRELETATLDKLSAEHNTIIALGGGTMANEKNVEIMKQSGKIIYLKVSPEMIYKRIKNKIDRPLFRDLVLEEKPKEDFIERILEILDEREKYYRLADMVVESEDKPLGITVDTIARELKRRGL
ncbi:MAG: shikimate kinase [Rhodothermaceae bacterium]